MSYTVLSERTPTARRTYRCYLCGRTILSGEKYYREAVVCDGDFHDVTLHLDCDELRNEYEDEYPGEEYTFEWVWDWHRDREEQRKADKEVSQ